MMSMIAFAANSILCRLALLDGAIDAGSFTFLRIVSGAIVLFIMTRLISYNKHKKSNKSIKITFATSFMLFLYAITFSYGYINIATGTGALILFASVQVCMIIVHLCSGKPMSKLEWLGIVISILGFIYLLLPSSTRPDLFSALLMVVSGVSWAIFTLLGKKSTSAVQSISDSFIGASLLVIILSPWIVNFQNITTAGANLAILSGAVASAGGYLLWYFILPKLSVLKASIIQLTVPAFAIIGGSVLLTEPITLPLIISTLLILGGISLVFMSKSK